MLSSPTRGLKGSGTVTRFRVRTFVVHIFQEMGQWASELTHRSGNVVSGLAIGYL
jgi:hypothetical protein